jgi:hypothetical protein
MPSVRAAAARCTKSTAFTIAVCLGISTALVPSAQATAAGGWPSVGTVPASAPIYGSWYTNPVSVIAAEAGSPTLAAELFNRADSYDLYGSVPGGWSTTPYVNYGSYAGFSTDLAAHAVPPVHVVMYDPELWDRRDDVPELQIGFADPLRALTPIEEQQHPTVYMPKFARLAHRNGYFVIEAPGLNLMNVVGGDCVHGQGESDITAFLRCGIPAAAAAQSDAIDVQFQSEECQTSVYAADVAKAADQANQANPNAAVLSGLSTGWCHPTGDQLLAAYQAVGGSTSGHFFAIPSNVLAALDFFSLLAPVIVGDTGISPSEQIQMPGVTTCWRVSWNAKNQHSVTDRSGLGLFDSGLHKAGYVFRYTFEGAGTYTATDVATGDTGTVAVPGTVSPAFGLPDTTFIVTVATVQPPAGYVYEGQILRPGGDWAEWGTGISASFVPDGGLGTYAFRARMVRKSTGAASGWSPPISIIVVDVLPAPRSGGGTPVAVAPNSR